HRWPPAPAAPEPPAPAAPDPRLPAELFWRLGLLVRGGELPPVLVGCLDGAGQDQAQAGGQAGDGLLVEFVEVVQDVSVEFAAGAGGQVPDHAAGHVVGLGCFQRPVVCPAGAVSDGEGEVVAVLALLAGDDELRGAPVLARSDEI